MANFEQDVMRSLGHIEGTLEGIDARLQTREEVDGDQETRIAKLEHARSKSKGAVGVIAALVSAAVTVLVAALKGLFTS